MPLCPGSDSLTQAAIKQELVSWEQGEISINGHTHIFLHSAGFNVWQVSHLE